MEAIRDAIWAIENLPDHRARYVKEQFDRKFPHNEVSLSHFSSRGHFLPKNALEVVSFLEILVVYACVKESWGVVLRVL